MTREEAIIAMQHGQIVRHYYFSPEEWVRLSRNKYEFEDGCKCDINEFWKHRTGGSWESGWEIVTDKEKDIIRISGSLSISVDKRGNASFLVNGEDSGLWLTCREFNNLQRKLVERFEGNKND